MSSFPLMALFKLGGGRIALMCVPVDLCAGRAFDDRKCFVSVVFCELTGLFVY